MNWTRDDIPADTICAALRYEEGRLFWVGRRDGFFSEPRMRTKWHSTHEGREVAFSTDPRGYKYIKFANFSFKAHRVVWAMFHGGWPPEEIDHINGDKGDNRIENLRAVSASLNSRNRSRRRDNTSGVPGVFWDKRASRWFAGITELNGKYRYLGRFKTLEEARAVRAEAEKHHGYSLRHGRDIAECEDSALNAHAAHLRAVA